MRRKVTCKNILCKFHTKTNGNTLKAEFYLD